MFSLQFSIKRFEIDGNLNREKNIKMFCSDLQAKINLFLFCKIILSVIIKNICMDFYSRMSDVPQYDGHFIHFIPFHARIKNVM